MRRPGEQSVGGDNKVICKVIIFCILLISGCTILGVSFSVIEPTELGLYYNPNRKKLDRDKVWQNGRHLVCPGCTFKLYPKNLILFEYSHGKGSVMHCWTSDKQELDIEVYVQVKIKSDKVPEIFDKYQYDYIGPWSQKIQLALKQTTKDYTTQSFFEERLAVSAAIKAEIETYLSAEGLDVHSMHIGQVTIPTQFEDAITTKVVTQQNAATVLMQRNVTIIEAETAIINSQADADAAVIVGDATAEASVLVATADAQAIKIVQQAEAKGLQTIKTELSLTTDQILELKFNREIKNLGAETYINVGYEDEALFTKVRT